MYDNILISSFGSNIYSTIGFLEGMKDELSSTVIWNVVGNASLIIFLKIIGFSYSQMTEKLESLQIAHTFLNCFSIIPEDQEEKKKYILNWMEEKINETSLLDIDCNLKDIFRLTNIFPSFLTWSRTEKKIISLNPSTYPELKFTDCVLSTLSCIGTFNEHKISDNIYGNLNSLNSFPYKNVFSFRPDLKTLFLGNETSLINDLEENFVTPLSNIEDELIFQFLEKNKILLEETLENKAIIYSDLWKDVDPQKMESLYKSGFNQSKNFMSGSDTYLSFITERDEIENQK